MDETENHEFVNAAKSPHVDDAAKSQDIVHPFLQCKSCQQIFHVPRILPCGHTFCLQCIQKTTNACCILCNTEWSLPVDGSLDLKRNLVVEYFITNRSLLATCAMDNNNGHERPNFFCVDCWDALCEKCMLGHTQFNNITKHHMVKTMADINQTDIEKHVRRVKLTCLEHKDRLMEFYCTKCDKFICHTCYVLSHDKHHCMSVKEADEKLIKQLDTSIEKIQDNVNRLEEMIQIVTSSKDKLELDKKTLVETVTTLIHEAKQNLLSEYNKIVIQIDNCYEGVLELLAEKSASRKTYLERIHDETQQKLQFSRDVLSSLRKYASSMSTAVDRAALLKDKSIKELAVTLKFNHSHLLNWQMPYIAPWKSYMNRWLQSCLNALTSVGHVPRLHEQDHITITSQQARFECVHYSLIIVRT